MNIIVCGDRHWSDRDAILRDLTRVKDSIIKREPTTRPEDIVIIHGGATGADTIAGEVAKELGFEVRVFRADWEGKGRAAGPIRNKRMIDDGKPDLVLAYHADLKKSKGTANMVLQATTAGIPVMVRDK